GVVGDGSRVSAHAMLNDLDADPLRPDGELIDGCGPECVTGAKHHLFAQLVFEDPGELGDTGGFAGTVDASDQDDGGAAGGELQLAVDIRGEDLKQLLLDDAFSFLGVFNAPQAPAITNG